MFYISDYTGFRLVCCACLPNIRAVLRACGLLARNSVSFHYIFRSPSDVDSLGRASVLCDGATLRPRSVPENHLYQSFIHSSETPSHPHTAPHTPTELEQQLERARSEERNNCDFKESVAEGKIDISRKLKIDVKLRSKWIPRNFPSCRRSSNKTGASGIDRSGKGREVGGEVGRRALSRTGV